MHSSLPAEVAKVDQEITIELDSIAVAGESAGGSINHIQGRVFMLESDCVTPLEDIRRSSPPFSFQRCAFVRFWLNTALSTSTALITTPLQRSSRRESRWSTCT